MYKILKKSKKKILGQASDKSFFVQGSYYIRYYNTLVEAQKDFDKSRQLNDH